MIEPANDNELFAITNPTPREWGFLVLFMTVCVLAGWSFGMGWNSMAAMIARNL